jgi:hypothetical protein
VSVSNWKTLFNVPSSSFGFILEKAGKSTVEIGVEKKVIRKAKFVATE